MRLDRWVGWTTVLVVLVDGLTKFWIRNTVMLHQTIELLGGWVRLVHLRNDGVAFGLLGGDAFAWMLPLLTAASLVAIVWLAMLAGAAERRRVRVAAALVLGGAVANLTDRLADGGVTDFLLVRHFPFVFNVADVAITIGGATLAVLVSRAGEVRARRPGAA